MKSIIALIVVALTFLSIQKIDKKCDDKIPLYSFANFMGIKYNQNQKDLSKLYGNATGVEFNDDSTAFIYDYQFSKNIPLKVYVNSQTKIIETIFVEMLCYAKDIEKDKIRLKTDFEIDKCHLNLFGQKPTDIVRILGIAENDEINESSVEKDVRTFNYYTDDDKIQITFKFYPSQKYNMSSISVNYYYD